MTARRYALSMMVIVITALVIRLFYLYQIRTIPFFHVFLVDAETYNAWANSIAAGNWWGDEPFYQAPLYPYFLAVIKIVVGNAPWAPRVIQAILGAFSCGLIASAGASFFSKRVGLLAGGLMALYPPAIFYDGLIQKASLGNFLLALLLALLGWSWKQNRIFISITIGIVLGLLCITRENSLALMPLVIAWFSIRQRSEASRRSPVLNAVAVLAGVSCILGLVGFRNWSVGHALTPTTFNYGPAFYIGNNPRANGRVVTLIPGRTTAVQERDDFRRLAEKAMGHPLTPQEISAYWLKRSWEFIRMHPLEWLKLSGYKWLLVWNAYEIPDVEAVSIYAEWSSLLHTILPFFHFGILAPFAAVGLLFCLPRFRELWLLYMMPIVMACSTALFFVLGRYRYPLVPVLVLFAAAAFGEKTRWKTLSFRRWAITIEIAVLVAVLTNLRINPERELNAIARGNLSMAFLRSDEPAVATELQEQAVKEAPSSAILHNNLGVLYSLQQRHQEALWQLQEAVRIEPELPDLEYRIALEFELLGQNAAAIASYRRAIEMNPNDSYARQAFERLSVTSGRVKEDWAE